MARMALRWRRPDLDASSSHRQDYHLHACSLDRQYKAHFHWLLSIPFTIAPCLRASRGSCRYLRASSQQ